MGRTVRNRNVEEEEEKGGGEEEEGEEGGLGRGNLDSVEKCGIKIVRKRE
jgi:hypothetical protein